MAIGFQHIFLKRCGRLLCAATFFIASLSFAAEDDTTKSSGLKIGSELFDVGVLFGTINIEDFTSEYVAGMNITFKATEYFFLQYNYVQTEIGQSSWELGSLADYGLGDDRLFKHYDLLIGYNIFQGEFFAGGDRSHLSNLYVVAGVGDTNFGREQNFTYTLGLGYQIEFFRRFLVRADFRDYMFKSSLTIGDEEDLVHNTQISLGVGYLF